MRKSFLYVAAQKVFFTAAANEMSSRLMTFASRPKNQRRNPIGIISIYHCQYHDNISVIIVVLLFPLLLSLLLLL